MFRFLNSTPARVATILLLMQCGLLYSSIRPEFIPVSRPLVQVPKTLGAWNAFGEDGVVDAESMAVLKADDTLSRTYQKEGRMAANLFVAGFRSQRTGKAPHSPKNCLPGSGWLPLADNEITVDVGGASIPVNRYVIAHGEERQLVYYWYQSRERAVAGEFKAKFWVIADAIRYNRTDTALVRVIVPILNRDEATADKQAAEFVGSFYTTLLDYLPKA